MLWRLFAASTLASWWSLPKKTRQLQRPIVQVFSTPNNRCCKTSSIPRCRPIHNRIDIRSCTVRTRLVRIRGHGWTQHVDARHYVQRIAHEDHDAPAWSAEAHGRTSRAGETKTKRIVRAPWERGGGDDVLGRNHGTHQVVLASLGRSSRHWRDRRRWCGRCCNAWRRRWMDEASGGTLARSGSVGTGVLRWCLRLGHRALLSSQRPHIGGRLPVWTYQRHSPGVLGKHDGSSRRFRTLENRTPSIRGQEVGRLSEVRGGGSSCICRRWKGRAAVAPVAPLPLQPVQLHVWIDKH
mmetsp:Transcript_2138/g.14052  ORF Transcript_2138/g.14052 Transcript_2138/m.14052 type:complete len:295 (-) Transcript_2138:1600-2484(-)